MPKWIKKKCITCYCCVELCPHEAVDFKLNYVKNALFSWPCISLILIIIFIISLFIWVF
ncbi:MAG: 4Fe-4S binding protein [Candidatus Hermodarchaeota archaeon]